MPAAVPYSKPVYNPLVAFPELARLRTLAQRRDWDSISDFFAGLDDESDVVAAALAVAETPEADVFLGAVAAERPSEVLPRSLLAHHHITTGWKIRSGYRAEHVSRQQFDDFHSYLRKAERLLIDVTAEQPDHALGWHLRLMTARGLQLGQAEARRRYDRLAAHHPHHYRAQSQLLQQLCPKWSGSWEAVHAFADECWKDAPPGGLGPLITVEAHLEHWMDLDDSERHTYFWGEGVQESLVAAAEASVLHADHEQDMSWIIAHSCLAAALSLARMPEQAAVHFTALGEFASEYPWSSLSGEPDKLIRDYRDAALGKG